MGSGTQIILDEIKEFREFAEDSSEKTMNILLEIKEILGEVICISVLGQDQKCFHENLHYLISSTRFS